VQRENNFIVLGYLFIYS